MSEFGGEPRRGEEAAAIEKDEEKEEEEEEATDDVAVEGEQQRRARVTYAIPLPPNSSRHGIAAPHCPGTPGVGHDPGHTPGGG